jgi:hypothetical protein
MLHCRLIAHVLGRLQARIFSAKNAEKYGKN